MDLQLKGKKALVLGGSRGFGRAVALRLGQEGAQCAIVSRHEESIRQAAQQLQEQTGATYFPLVGDTTDATSIRQVVDQAAQQLGGLEILVNSAARPSGDLPEDFEHVDEALILHDFEEKFLGTLRAARAAAKYMQQAGWGRIVSVGGLTARTAGSVSAGARNAALVHLTRTMASALGRYNITANVVHPATSVTETLRERLSRGAAATGESVDALIEAAARQNALGRLITADEIADVILFLCSPRSVAITGESISVGGGTGTAVYY